MGCCIEVPTLQSVWDSETADYDEDPSTPETNRDLVYEAMEAQANAYRKIFGKTLQQSQQK